MTDLSFCICNRINYVILHFRVSKSINRTSMSYLLEELKMWKILRFVRVAALSLPLRCLILCLTFSASHYDRIQISKLACYLIESILSNTSKWNTEIDRIENGEFKLLTYSNFPKKKGSKPCPQNWGLRHLWQKMENGVKTQKMVGEDGCGWEQGSKKR